MTPLLSDEQRAAVQAVRQRNWTRPFTAERELRGLATGAYSVPDITTTVTVMSGDWTWVDQVERRATAGGTVDKAKLLLGTNVLNSGALVNAGRVRVDGILCTITEASAFYDSGEVVIRAVRVQ